MPTDSPDARDTSDSAANRPPGGPGETIARHFVFHFDAATNALVRVEEIDPSSDHLSAGQSYDPYATAAYLQPSAAEYAPYLGYPYYQGYPYDPGYSPYSGIAAYAGYGLPPFPGYGVHPTYPVAPRSPAPVRPVPVVPPVLNRPPILVRPPVLIDHPIRPPSL